MASVLVVDPVHVLEDLTHGRERVELARLDRVEQLRELGLLRHRRLQVRLRPARRRREHLAGEVLPPPLLEQALRLEEARGAPRACAQSSGTFSPRTRLGQDDRRAPRALAVEREDRAHLVQHRLRGWVIHLVDRDHVGDLHDPRFQRLDGVARAGHQHEQDRVRDPDHLDLALAGADRLEEDDVLAGRVEQEHRLQRRLREPAEMAARPHRADEDAGVEEVVGEPDPVAEQRALRERARRIDRDDARPSCPRSRTCRTSALISDDLPTPGGPVTPTTNAEPVSG